jgi:hypothetical protein
MEGATASSPPRDNIAMQKEGKDRGVPSVKADWRSMAEFDPSKPALVHDKLNDQVIDWKPERYQRHYGAFATPFDPGVVVGWPAARRLEATVTRRAKAT